MGAQRGVPRLHPRPPARRRPAAGARDRGPQRRAVAVDRLDQQQHRLAHARHDVGTRPGRDRRPQRRPAAVGPDGALPAARRPRRRPGRGGGHPDRDPAGHQGARRRPRAPHPRALHARPLPGPARHARRPARAGRDRARRGRGPRRRLVDAGRGRRARRRLARAHGAAVAVRQPAVRPGADRAALRLHAPARDLHAEGQTALGLLRAADPAPRPADRPRRPGDRPQGGRLVAHAIHREPDAPRGKAVAKAIRRELERLAKWQGAGDLELREVPEAWPLG